LNMTMFSKFAHVDCHVSGPGYPWRNSILAMCAPDLTGCNLVDTKILATRSSENTTSSNMPSCRQYSETIVSSTEQCCTFTFSSHIVQIHQQDCNA
jgi:hypothetical protein